MHKLREIEGCSIGEIYLLAKINCRHCWQCLSFHCIRKKRQSFEKYVSFHMQLIFILKNWLDCYKH